MIIISVIYFRISYLCFINEDITYPYENDIHFNKHLHINSLLLSI